MKKPTAKEYRDAEYNLIAGCAPATFPCGKCKWPVLDGYVCRFCKDENPYEDSKGREVRDWK